MHTDAIKADSFYDSNSNTLYLLDGRNITGSVKIEWWNTIYNNNYYSSETENNIAWTENAEILITAGLNEEKTTAFNLGWDFSKSQSGAKNQPFFAYFSDQTLTSPTNENTDGIIKHFIFDDTSDSNEINIVTRNSTVEQSNSGDSAALIGLSLSNKRGWITFNDSTSLISDFYFDYTAQQEEGLRNNSEVPEYIAAGVYTTFEAYAQSILDYIFTKNGDGFTANLKDKDSISKFGLIEFNKHSVVSVTATDMPNKKETSNANAVSGEPILLNEAFGVFANEGGSVVFHDGADILVKGRDNHRLVSAIAAASSLGVLDPLKQGEITVATDKSNNTATRIWSWSDSYDGEKPFIVGGDKSLFEENK